jgi:BlaI family penicillinase repressor
MEELTKTEERIMQTLWNLKSAFIKDIIDNLPDDPKPPYNTISSVVRLLETKNYIGHKAYGKTHEYFPLISKTAYRKHSFTKLLTNYFDGSAESLLSFMVSEKKLKEDDIESIREFINKQK